MRKTQSCRKHCLLLMLVLSFTLSFSQKTPQDLVKARTKILADPKVKSVEINEERQTPSLIVLKESQFFNKEQAPLALATYLNVRTGVDIITPVKQIKLKQNVEVDEFNQYFKGIKVEHAHFRAFSNNGAIRFFNGAWFDIPVNLPVHPSLNESAALLKAKATVGAKKYAWEEIQELIEKNQSNAGVKDAWRRNWLNTSQKGSL